MANLTEYFVQLVNARTKAPIDDDTGVYLVLTAGSPVLQTVYADAQGATTPTYAATGCAQTMTNGQIRFWTATSVTSVDLVVQTAAGQAIFVQALTPSQHRIEVNTESAAQLLVIPYYNYLPTPFVSASVTQTGSTWGTGFSVPIKSNLKRVYARVITAVTAGLRNVGNSAAASAYLRAITASVTGYKNPPQRAWTDVTTNSVTATFDFGSAFYTAVTNINRVHCVPIAAATAIVFSNDTAADVAADAGYIFVEYDLIRN